MSAVSGLLAAYTRLNSFSALTEKARRDDDANMSSRQDACLELCRLLAPQERETASLDALEFQTILRSRCGVSQPELEALRSAIENGDSLGSSVDVLEKISRSLIRERSAMAGRISGG